MGTIVDTSSLIALALYQREYVPPEAILGATLRAHLEDAGWSYHHPLDGVIEALILGDDLLFDGPSIARNAQRFPEIVAFSALGEALWEGDSTLEDRVYGFIVENYIPKIRNRGPMTLDFLAGHTQKWMSAELGNDLEYLSVSWNQLESSLVGRVRDAATALREQFGVYKPKWGAALAVLLRSLYYDCLQQWASADLIVHPAKSRLLEGAWGAREGSLANRGDQSMAISNILSLFDNEVRHAFYRRKEKWLGRQDLTYKVPMLTSYVLNQCSSRSDLSRVIEDIRTSRQAEQFRQSVRWLLDSARNRRNDDVDEVLTQLDAAVEAWNKDIRAKGPKRKVTVGIPLMNLSTDLELPMPTIARGPGEKLLVFIHSLLRES